MNRLPRTAALLALLTPFATAQDVELFAGNGVAGDGMGRSVDMDGRTVAVGALTDSVGVDAGSVYVWATDGAAFAFEAEFQPDAGGGAGDEFGTSVGVDLDTCVVGSPREDDGVTLDTGVTYVFTRTMSTWFQSFKILASDPAADDRFGTSVAISGLTAIVGAPTKDGGSTDEGAAYVFTGMVGTGMWSQQQKLVSPAPTAGSLFGQVVDIDGDTAVVAEPLSDTGATNAGEVHVYTRTAGVWSLQQTLASPAPASSEAFGTDVGLNGDRLVVGTEADVVYFYERTGGTWSLIATFTAPEGAATGFGEKVDTNGSKVVVGASLVDSGEGAFYFYADRAGWIFDGKRTLPTPAAGDALATDVAIDGVFTAAGAVGRDVLAAEAGSVLIDDARLLEPGSITCWGLGCPCGNDDIEAGCANSTGSGGIIHGSGTNSIAADDMVLTASGLPPMNQGLFYMSNAQIPAAPLTDGLQCALGTTSWRYLNQIQTIGVGGTMTLVMPVADSGGLINSPGRTWWFQVWHRDVPTMVCGNFANLSSAYEVTFTP